MNSLPEITRYLQHHDIEFQCFEHPPLFTCEDSKKYNLHFPGADTKNLFLREERGSRFFLVTVPHAKSVDLKKLATLIGVKRFSFGTPEEMLQKLGVRPGSVTLLALANDSPATIEVYIDHAVWGAPRIQCHPLINTATLVIEKSGFEKFFAATGHTPHPVEVPVRVQLN